MTKIAKDERMDGLCLMSTVANSGPSFLASADIINAILILHDEPFQRPAGLLGDHRIWKFR